MGAPGFRGAEQTISSYVAGYDAQDPAPTPSHLQAALALRTAAALADIANRYGDPTRAIGSAVLAHLIIGLRS